MHCFSLAILNIQSRFSLPAKLTHCRRSYAVKHYLNEVNSIKKTIKQTTYVTYELLFLTCGQARTRIKHTPVNQSAELERTRYSKRYAPTASIVFNQRTRVRLIGAIDSALTTQSYCGLAIRMIS